MQEHTPMQDGLYTGRIDAEDIYIPRAQDAARVFDSLPTHSLFLDERLFMYPFVRVKYDGKEIIIPAREAIRVLADGEHEHYVPLVYAAQDAQTAVDNRLTHLLAQRHVYISEAVYRHVQDELHVDTEYLNRRVHIRGLGQTPHRITLIREAYESWERLRSGLKVPRAQERIISAPQEVADRRALVQILDERGKPARHANAEGLIDAFLYAYSMDGPHTVCCAQYDLPLHLRRLAHGLRSRQVRGIDRDILPATTLDTLTFRYGFGQQPIVERGPSFWELYQEE